jgi:hypothetical protein
MATPAICTIAAQFKVAGVQHTVVHGTMNLDHQGGSGLGMIGPGGASGGFVFSMTKL